MLTIERSKNRCEEPSEAPTCKSKPLGDALSLAQIEVSSATCTGVHASELCVNTGGPWNMRAKAIRTRFERL